MHLYTPTTAPKIRPMHAKRVITHSGTCMDVCRPQRVINSDLIEFLESQNVDGMEVKKSKIGNVSVVKLQNILSKLSLTS